MGASAQELTVALCRRRVAVYPGDGLGEVGATTTIRINLSDPRPARPRALRRGVPEAVEEAASGDTARACATSSWRGTERGRRLAAVIAG